MLTSASRVFSAIRNWTDRLYILFSHQQGIPSVQLKSYSLAWKWWRKATELEWGREKLPVAKRNVSLFPYPSPLPAFVRTRAQRSSSSLPSLNKTSGKFSLANILAPFVWDIMFSISRVYWLERRCYEIKVSEALVIASFGHQGRLTLA